MRTPPDTRAHCEKCGFRLDYEIGSIEWQHRDHDFCGLSKCHGKGLPGYKPELDGFAYNAKKYLESKEGIQGLSEAIKNARAMSDKLDQARKLTWEQLNTPIDI